MSAGHNTAAEQRKKIWPGLCFGVAMAVIPLIVLITQVPWILKIYHGPRPITAAEFQQYNGGQPTDDYVEFEVPQSIDTELAVGYKRGKTVSRYIFVRVGNQWMLANVPPDYRGEKLVGFVRRLDDYDCKQDREALDRVSNKPPNPPLMPYVIHAGKDQKEEVLLCFVAVGVFTLVGVFICWTARQKLAAIAKAQQFREQWN